ncbi:hypothetical protein [Streptomyces sp. CC208A]|uniref:hypothetical protein n=1 Tax=Streptomyces sp. CC208A TaxID=3044573 RepID=UPI0024A8FC9D|nr:hypothetical protein [Streptomyces sp. CC208A]
MTVPVDTLAARPARSLPDTVRYEFNGLVLTLPPWRSLPADLPGRSGGDMVELLRAVAGEDRIRELAAAGLTLGHLEAIGEDWRRRDEPDSGPGRLLPAGSRPEPLAGEARGWRKLLSRRALRVRTGTAAERSARVLHLPGPDGAALSRDRAREVRPPRTGT